MLPSQCILFCHFSLFLRLVRYLWYSKTLRHVADYVISIYHFYFIDVLKDLERSLFYGEHTKCVFCFVWLVSRHTSSVKFQASYI